MKNIRSRGAHPTTRFGFPLLAFFVVLGSLFFSRILDAAPSSRLVYGRPGEGVICPDESELRAAVRSRLGYDPFFPWAAQTIVVHVAQRASRRLSGRVYLVDSSGRASPEREFTTSLGECDELMQTLALAIVITLDPLHGTTAGAAQNTSRAPSAAKAGEVRAPSTESTASDAVGSSLASKKDPGAATLAGEGRSDSPKTTAAVVPDTSETIRPDVAVQTSEAEGRSRPIHLDLGVGMLGAVGMMPGISVGATPFVRLRRAPYSFGLEGRFERLAWSDENGDRATVGLVGGTAVPCYHVSNITLCWAVLVGRYSAEGVYPAARSASAPFVATGARIGAEIPLATGVWAFVRAEALVNMSRHQLTLAGESFWQVSMWSFSLSAGAVASIF